MLKNRQSYRLASPNLQRWLHGYRGSQGAINKARIENRKGVENGSGDGAVDSISSGVLLRKMVAEAEGKKNGKHLPERMGFSDQEMIRQVMR